ncbi:hypothetical protein PRNP1_001608 [Phytophthora ramorum]
MEQSRSFSSTSKRTKHLRGYDIAAVKFQLATYCRTSPCVAHALERFRWELKPGVRCTTNYWGSLRKELQIANGKTLVLAAGDGYIGTANANAYSEIICKFLKQGWYVEIHAWLHALNNGYLILQSEHPGRVVVKPLDDVVCVLAHPNEREYLHTARKLSNSLLGGPGRLAEPYVRPSVPPPRPMQEAQPRRSAIPVRDNSAIAYLAPIGEKTRATSALPGTLGPTSWANVVTQGRTVTPAPENTSPGSTLFGPTDTPQLSSPVSPARVPAPTRPPRSPSFVQFGLMWSLQIQQMQDLLSSQLADLAMRQTVLQQTTELMRLMREREQEQRLHPLGQYNIDRPEHRGTLGPVQGDSELQRRVDVLNKR